MEGMYKVREAKEYFNSLPDNLLDKYVVVSVKNNTLWTINGIMLVDKPQDGKTLTEYFYTYSKERLKDMSNENKVRSDITGQDLNKTLHESNEEKIDNMDIFKAIKASDEMEEKLDQALESLERNISKANKAKELFEHYYRNILTYRLNGNLLIDSKWIKDQAMKLTKDHINGIHEIGNSPWDPR